MAATLPSSGSDGSWSSNPDDLETPVPLVDLDRLERNLDRMAAYAASHRLALRPHTKTHKSPLIGAEQLRRGAVGLTCATPLEAEVMSEVCDDILLAYQAIGAPKLQRLMALPDRVRLTVALDSPDAVERIARAAQARRRAVGVYVELDLGMHRVGVTASEEMLKLVRLVSARPPLEYRGIMFYPGHIRAPVGQQGKDLERLATSLGDALQILDRSGLSPSVVSGGSTPTVWDTDQIGGLTEVRPGTYVYNDRTTVQVGACAWDDCALTVLASVISTAVPGQAVVDAGSKALGREPPQTEGDGYGALLDLPEVTVQRLSEEHGILDLSRTTWRPAVGEQVRIVPNHVCVAVHLHEVIYGTRGNRIETSWPVVARGRRPIRPPVAV
ncbi:MAG TPA: alanine racemase [Gemmatimonadales bacterium]|nr:alanine racemase [Gemmatimonadales bacterium]